MTSSGNVQATIVSTQGWWPEFVHSFAAYYPLNSVLPVQVNTTAKVKEITAQFSWTGHSEFNRTLLSPDNLTWSNTSLPLSKRGNWTVTISAFDDAGYHSVITAGFYVGAPDLALTALSIPDKGYVGYSITITANIHALNTTVQHVNVSLYVNSVSVDWKKDITIQKDENQTVQFTRTFTSKGTYKISVRVAHPDDSNPGNNEKWKNITMEGVPDLDVLNISVTPVPVNEGNPVMITVRIKNIGDGNATNYTVVLYCEQNGPRYSSLRFHPRYF
jgi:hypothetical protein